MPDFTDMLEEQRKITIIAYLGGRPRRMNAAHAWRQAINERLLNQADIVSIQLADGSISEAQACEVPELAAVFEEASREKSTTHTSASLVESASPEKTSSGSVHPAAEVAVNLGAKLAPKENDAEPDEREAPNLADAPTELPVTESYAQPSASAFIVDAQGVVTPPLSNSIASAPPPTPAASWSRSLWTVAGIVFVLFLLSRACGVNTSTNTPEKQSAADARYLALENTFLRTEPTAVRDNRARDASGIPIVVHAGTVLWGAIELSSSNHSSRWLRITQGPYAGSYVWAGTFVQQ